MERLRHAAMADSTHRTYDTGVQRFLSFCDSHEETAHRIANVETVALWLTSLAEQRTAPNTMSVYLSAVKKAVEEKTLEGVPLNDSPLIRDVLKGYTRTYSPPSTDANTSRSISAPFTLESFRSAVRAWRRNADGRPPTYDRTLLLAAMSLGLGACLRPGEYLKTNAAQRTEALLPVSQLSFVLHDDPRRQEIPWSDFQLRLSSHTNEQSVARIILHLRCSKTDQTKRGSSVPIDDPLCVSLIVAYLRIRPLVDSVGQTLEALLIDLSSGVPQQYTSLQMTKDMRSFLSAYGFPNAHDFSAKSLRSGAAQSLTDEGAPSFAIQAKGRWKSLKTPISNYLYRPTSSKAHQ